MLNTSEAMEMTKQTCEDCERAQYFFPSLSCFCSQLLYNGYILFHNGLALFVLVKYSLFAGEITFIADGCLLVKYNATMRMFLSSMS